MRLQTANVLFSAIFQCLGCDHRAMCARPSLSGTPHVQPLAYPEPTSLFHVLRQLAYRLQRVL